MREFRKSFLIDEASSVLKDPVVLSQLLLKQEIIILNVKSNYVDSVKTVFQHSMKNLKENHVTHYVFKRIDGALTIRCLTLGPSIVAATVEETGRGELTGSLAYETLTHEIYVENPIGRISIGRVSIDNLPLELKQIIEKEVSSGREIKFPDVWINKFLYDFFIERIITDKGAFMYVLSGRDRFNRKYAVKILREKTIDGKVLAVNGDVNAIHEMLRGYLNSLEVSIVSKTELKRCLVRNGYDETYVDKLIVYKRYIARPKALVLLKNTYSVEEYVANPPVIVEDLADMGDLSQKVKEKPLNYRESLFINVRLSGALAIAHLLGIIHMDIKPQNILLIQDDSEVYGYAPLLSDFIGLPHVYGERVKLKKATAEYADTLSLLRGEADFSYDVYCLGATMYYALTGLKLRGRVLTNLVILKEVYGMNVPLKHYLIENPDLVGYLSRVENVVSMYKNKEIGLRETIDRLKDVVESIDGKEVSKNLSHVPEEYASVVKKMIELDERNRYRDSFTLWLDIVKVLEKLDLMNLVPSLETPF